MKSSQKKDTSWQEVSNWYGNIVDKDGHYHHQHTILPNLIRLLEVKNDSDILDLACGNGVLARTLKNYRSYLGIDLSTNLIFQARSLTKYGPAQFQVADITKKLPLRDRTFNIVTIVLALQNVEQYERVFENASKYLCQGGKFLIVINHPYFRIPRQTSWEIDPKNKLQYRRVNRYLSPMKIPINAHPSKGKQSSMTWSFHQPLSAYIRGLVQAGFVVEGIDEWISDKVSQGKASKMENRGRDEFPLFMAILATKVALGNQIG